MSVWLACMYIQPYACLVFAKVKRGYQVSWNWRYGCLLSTMWVLETKPMSSERAPSAFYCWVISPAQGIQFWVSPLLHWVRIFIPQDGMCEIEVWKLFTDSRLYHPILTHLPALISDLVQARQCVRRLSKRRLGFSCTKLLNEWDSMIWSSKNRSGKFIFCYENEKLNLYFSMDKKYLFSTGIP